MRMGILSGPQLMYFSLHWEIPVQAFLFFLFGTWHVQMIYFQVIMCVCDLNLLWLEGLLR